MHCRGHRGCPTPPQEAVKQCTSFLFPAPNFIRLLMDLNIPKAGFRHVSEFISRPGGGGGSYRGNGPPISLAHPHWATILGHLEGDDQAP